MKVETKNVFASITATQPIENVTLVHTHASCPLRNTSIGII